jgi:uncharacterized protein (DUF1778 family)
VVVDPEDIEWDEANREHATRHGISVEEGELADYYYDHRNDPDMLGEQVEYVPPRAARVAVRLSFEEEGRIRQAAQGAGMSVSAFLRQAGLSAAGADVVNLERLRRTVNEARARIDDAWQALT